MYKNLSKTLFQRTLDSNLKLLSKFNRTYADEASFDTLDFKLHKLTEGPATNVSVTRADALKMFEQMYTLRHMENAAANLYKEKFIRGFCHLYNGQEACAVGMKAAMRPDDSVITAYRCHGWTNLMDVSVFAVLAELTGRQGGNVRGKGGSMHMYSKNYYGGNGIVGAQVPLGVGVAFASKYKGKKAVCFSLYGDGAANQGQVFEVYNIAKLFSIPVIFVCENNGYGLGTSSKRSSAVDEYYTRGDFVPGIWADGMDVLAVRSATKYAIDYCDSGKGPIVMELATYRYFGHSMSDPGISYRRREEVQQIREKRDPIATFREKMVSSELATAEEIKAIEKKLKSQIEEATEKSKTDKIISVDELAADVYSKPLVPEVRGLMPHKPYKHILINKPINLT